MLYPRFGTFKNLYWSCHWHVFQTAGFIRFKSLVFFGKWICLLQKCIGIHSWGFWGCLDMYYILELSIRHLRWLGNLLTIILGLLTSFVEWFQTKALVMSTDQKITSKEEVIIKPSISFCLRVFHMFIAVACDYWIEQKINCVLIWLVTYMGKNTIDVVFLQIMKTREIVC